MNSDFGYFEEESLGKPDNLAVAQRLYPYAKPYRWLFLLTIALVVVLTLLDLSIPYVTKVAIDRFIVPKSASILPKDPYSAGYAIREYRIDASNPVLNEMAQKYPEYFSATGNAASIPFDRLQKLQKEDLQKLRQKDLNGVGIAAAVLLLLIVAGLIFHFFQVMVLEYAGQAIMHDLRMALFMVIERQNLAFFTRNPVGRLVTRVTNDVQNMHELFTSVIVVVFKDLFLLVGIACVLLAIDWRLALISFTVLPFVVAASFRFADLARDAFRTLRIKLAEINVHFSETIAGIRVIQLFLYEMDNRRRFEKINHENYLAGLRQIRVFALFMPVIEILGAIAIAVIVYYGGGATVSERISLGSLVAFLSYMRMFFNPIRDLAEKYNVMQNAMASAERIFQVLDAGHALEIPFEPPASPSKDPAPIRQIVFQDVSFHYVKGEPVLERISFEVSSGKTLAIAGPTGSGKTSLINLIPRFYDPVSGKILINGVDSKDWDLFFLRKRLALVTQDPFLFTGTLYDNIFQGTEIRDQEKIKQVLEQAGCAHLMRRFPEGLQTKVLEGGKSLSSGERQLISIARAFAKNPDLVILDEATSYVDSETESWIQNALFTLTAKKACILIAHRLSTARRADRILILNRGRIVESGTHEELMNQQGIYSRLYRLQNEETHTGKKTSDHVIPARMSGKPV